MADHKDHQDYAILKELISSAHKTGFNDLEIREKYFSRFGNLFDRVMEDLKNDHKNHPDYPGIRLLVSNSVKASMGIEIIRTHYLSLYGPLLDKVLEDYVKDMNGVYVLQDPKAIIAADLQKIGYKWYAGPGPHSVRWLGVFDKLKLQNLPHEDLESIDKASTRVVSLLPSPSGESFSGRGLVLGYVQSGKTTNFVSVIAKAADEGYRLIIVLSGITNNLRNQTQVRLEKTLSNENHQSWHWLTSGEHDFSISANAINLLGNPNNRVIAVVKKNNSRLKRLHQWLASAPIGIRANLPFLLIDDEADQATVNSAKVINKQTAINKLVTQIIHKDFMPKSAYVGYTATPFANILSEAKNLDQIYPRDFILPLNKPPKYFGAEELFGRNPIDEDDQAVESGRNIIRSATQNQIIPLGRAAFKTSNPNEPVMTDALKSSIIWFLIATAVRRSRTKKVQFSTMLVHTAGTIAPHYEMKKLIEKQFEEWRSQELDQHQALFVAMYEMEVFTAHKDGDGEIPIWDNLWSIIKSIIVSTKVIEDNYKSQDRLNYDFEHENESVPIIVVGGNTLSRGLTLEGLTSSFFLRTSTAYDSLLQMGRWFGYRPGYEDLQRIWMQDDLIPLFRDLALVEEEIRAQISDWTDQGIRPDEVAVKIRQHPALNITAREKMLHAVRVQMGFSNQRIETISFHNDKAWLDGNIVATKNLIDDLVRTGYTIEKTQKDWPIFRNVPWSFIKKYLDEYHWVEGRTKATLELIVKYIERIQSRVGELERWNIYFYQLKDTVKPKRNVSCIEMSRINRSALERPKDGPVNIHNLVSSIDGAADIPLSDAEIGSSTEINGKVTDTGIIKLRDKYIPGRKGLLGIYLIDKDSKKQVNNKNRLDLDIVEDAIGLGFFFPNSEDKSALIEYVAAGLPEIPIDLDEQDIEAIDADDDD